MFASSSLEEIFHYVYYQLTSISMTFLDEVNSFSTDLFSNDFILAIINFFEMFAWGLGLTGAAIAMMEFAVTYRTGGGGSFLGTGMNMLRLFGALLLFAKIPILLFEFSTDMYAAVRESALGSMVDNDMTISTYAKGIIEGMFKSVYGTLPTVDILSNVWNFLTNLQDGFHSTDVSDAMLQSNAEWWALFQLIFVIWAIFKIFIGNLKRGGILLTQICVGSLHMYHLARGYTDGFTAWCKQVAALCFTVFMQNILYMLGLIMMNDAETTNIYLAMTLMLAAAEVPRIAQMFGLDTSTRGGIGSAARSASTAISLFKQFAH